MRKIILGLSALALAAAAAPALAQDAPASDLTVTGGATVVSDYRFRGISQTYKQFAVQGTFTVAHSSGFYATVWGSSVDDYIANGSDQEIDLIAGYKHAFGAATLDVGVLYYYYPGSGGVTSDFFEPYASVSGALGPVTAKLSAAYAPKQRALGFQDTNLDGVADREDNLYVAGDLSAGIPNTPISVSAHVGHTFGPSFITPNFSDEYTDWSVGASYTWKNLTFGVSYVDTDKDSFVGTRNITKSGVVGSVGVAF
jgi:uncharacterized protein (TIGR02001 family)